MNSDLGSQLSEHLTVCGEILELTQHENQALRQPESHSQFELCQSRRAVLPRLNECTRGLRRLSAQWQQLTPDERARQPEITTLIRQNQDLVMRILLLDRENQQFLLQRGLVPARHIPPAQSQRPHFVADLYRRNRVGLAHAD